MAYSPFPVTMPELSSYQGQLIGNRKPEYPPPLVCKSCGKENRRYATRDNGKGKRYYNLVCSTCKSAERRRQIRAIKDPLYIANMREQQRKYRLKRKFGLTVEEYDELLVIQGGVCAICKKPNPKDTFMPVDHDHKTGSVRGILCDTCNQAIGLFYDDTELMKNAIEYLKDEK